jgi:hypothetical protein
MAIAPDKADAPLIIDSDRVLSFPISSQRLQLIPRRRSQDPQFCRGVELEQFPQDDAFDGAEALTVMIVEKLLSLFRAKALNHTPRILRSTLHVNRFQRLEPLPNSVGRKRT